MPFQSLNLHLHNYNITPALWQCFEALNGCQIVLRALSHSKELTNSKEGRDCTTPVCIIFMYNIILYKNYIYISAVGRNAFQRFRKIFNFFKGTFQALIYIYIIHYTCMAVKSNIMTDKREETKLIHKAILSIFVSHFTCYIQ